MKTLALLGGMTPDVTALYYNTINQHVRNALGQRHSAKLYIYSVDLEEQLERFQSGNWEGFAAEYIEAVKPLVAQPARVDGVALCAILAHMVSDQLASSLPPNVKFLDVSESIAKNLKANRIQTAGLIGPAVTMTDRSPGFFLEKLTARHGLDIIVPESDAEIVEVNRGMVEEVVRGISAVKETTKQMFRETAQKFIQRGAQAIILGSTDLGFVLRQEDFPGTVVLDAAKVHASDLADWLIGGQTEVP